MEGDALKVLAEVAENWPHDAAAYSQQADCLLRLGRPEEALKVLDSAPDCYRRFAYYWAQLAKRKTTATSGCQSHKAITIPNESTATLIGKSLIASTPTAEPLWHLATTQLAPPSLEFRGPEGWGGGCILSKTMPCLVRRGAG